MSGRQADSRTALEVIADNVPLQGPASAGAGGVLSGDLVATFVRTPFNVRRNVVKVWRAPPPNVWTVLGSPADVSRSRRLEQKAVTSVAVMAALLIGGVSSVGYGQRCGNSVVRFPIVGGRIASGDIAARPGWYVSPGQTLASSLWVVVPSLAGWAFVRSIWIPSVAAGRQTRTATLVFARYLSGAYLYVYVMLAAGAALLVGLTLTAAERTETIRWCLWCFLFGESFFVPAVMWTRFVVHDSSGQVFGRARYAILAAYALLFVVIPIMGMAMENARGRDWLADTNTASVIADGMQGAGFPPSRWPQIW